MNEFETGVCVGILLQKRGHNANLDSVTFTANDTYTPTAPLDGWNSVTVNVKTWKAEYDAMVEKCEEVQETLQQIDPSYDPTDPDAPTIPEEIEKVAGYTYPTGTDPEDIAPLVGGDPVHDETLGGIAPAIVVGIDDNNGNWIMSGGYIDTNGDFVPLTGFDTGANAEQYPNAKPVVQYAKITDPTTGAMEYKVKYWAFGTIETSWTGTATSSDMIGYGDTNHQYKVYNT